MAVFISYASKDAADSEMLVRALERDGIRAWFAPETMRIGRFANQLAQNIAKCDVVLVIVSAATEFSDWVERELMFAQANGKTIVPIVLEAFPSDSWLQLLLGPYDWIDCRQRALAEQTSLVAQRVRDSVRLGRVVTFLNMKGGVGKTTLAANLGVCLHQEKNQSVLFVDLDPQYNITQFFLAESQIASLRQEGRTILRALDDQQASAESIRKAVDQRYALNDPSGTPRHNPAIDLISGNDDLFEYSLDLRSPDEKRRAVGNLHALIAASRRFFDLVIIDVNPSATFVTQCALAVADHIVAPVRPERYAIAGLTMLKKLLLKVRQRDIGSGELTVIVNQISQRHSTANTGITEQTVSLIREDEFYGSTLAPAVIPYSTVLQVGIDETPRNLPIDNAAVRAGAKASLKQSLLTDAEFMFNRAKGL